mmetsp:Transcript_13993/g.38237  ORF Transcript_13993/g.38237 Transcript_13993/m.38237 type:complete len:221 (-) Transcript_13993:161-823(-)
MTRAKSRFARWICSAEPDNNTFASSGAHSTFEPLSSVRSRRCSGVIKCSTSSFCTVIDVCGMTWALSFEKSIDVVSTFLSVTRLSAKRLAKSSCPPLAPGMPGMPCMPSMPCAALPTPPMGSAPFPSTPEKPAGGCKPDSEGPPDIANMASSCASAVASLPRTAALVSEKLPPPRPRPLSGRARLETGLPSSPDEDETSSTSISAERFIATCTPKPPALA